MPQSDVLPVDAVPKPEACLRIESGDFLIPPHGLWTSAADPVDHSVLSLIDGPVLDIGCGPGRHTEALLERGIAAMGVDISSSAVEMCRQRGLTVLKRSIFDSIPKAGEWRSGLLLDGNIGIGANPTLLLTRIAALLHRQACLIVEVEQSALLRSPSKVRLEIDGIAGPWFDWIQVDIETIATIAADTGYSLADMIVRGGRHFAILDRDS